MENKELRKKIEELDIKRKVSEMKGDVVNYDTDNQYHYISEEDILELLDKAREEGREEGRKDKEKEMYKTIEEILSDYRVGLFLDSFYVAKIVDFIKLEKEKSRKEGEKTRPTGEKELLKELMGIINWQSYVTVDVFEDKKSLSEQETEAGELIEKRATAFIERLVSQAREEEQDRLKPLLEKMAYCPECGWSMQVMKKNDLTWLNKYYCKNCGRVYKFKQI